MFAYIRTSFEDVDSRLLVRADIAELVPRRRRDYSRPGASAVGKRAAIRSSALPLTEVQRRRKDQAITAADDHDEDSPRFIGDDGVGVELGPSWLERRSADDE